ncbi:hypothetical protein RRF57_012385 [Xylaria bambusicola]|uniref:Uncharacterized protein n=1 Tax=Xylaria bambusicola TaxID=326684 RepID=A0AAN7UWE3_9PEZI
MTSPARGEHVGLVETPYGGWGVAGEGEMRGQPRDALNLRARVRLRVHGRAISFVLLALTEVDAAGQLTHDGKVGALAHLGLKGRRLRREEAGSKIAVCAHLLAQPQDALLGTHLARTPFRASDGAEQYRVSGLGGIESGVCKRGAVGVDGAL